MEFLRILEGLRVPALDSFFSLITHLGNETVFVLTAALFFWCLDKRCGYYILTVGCIGTSANQFLKLLCRVPRPWVIDPAFTIVESARSGAEGYSFPSGHSQSIVGTTTCIALTYKKKWVRILCVVLMVLVCFSRMYLGCHTPQDVAVGVGMALLLALVCFFVMRQVEKHPKLLGIMLLLSFFCTLLYTLYVEFGVSSEEVDAKNYGDALKSAYTLLGCALGAVLAHLLDEKYVRFDVRAPFLGQVLKLLLGAALLLGIKSGLKEPLLAVLPERAATVIRYFLVMFVGGLVWPLTFPLFASIGKKKRRVK